MRGSSGSVPKRCQHALGYSVAMAMFAASAGPALAGSQTFIFQQGLNGYTATADTFLKQSDPTVAQGAAQAAEWDGDDPPGTDNDNFALVAFGDIFGAAPDQVPAGSPIVSATLTLTIFNSGNPGSVYEAQVDWDESTTYNDFGGTGSAGVQTYEYAEFIASAPGASGTRNIDVTASLCRWTNDPANNRGWIIVPNNTDGVEFRSSEYASSPSLRPKLTVVISDTDPTITLVRHPYLQIGTPSSIIVKWRTNVASSGIVHYGDAPDNLILSVADATSCINHEVEITRLAPATRYYYDVAAGAQVLAGGDSEHYFDTAPMPFSATPFSTWIVGDSGTGGAAQAQVRDAMLAETIAARPDLFIHVGDMAYTDGTDGQFTDNFFAPYQDILRHTVCWPAIGNHEGNSSDSPTQSGPYYEAYVLPTAGQAGGLASGTEAYYAFDFANVHFVCLDSHDTDRSPGSTMLQWLEADLAATMQPWLVAFWHHPPYTKGTHDSDNVSDSGGRMRDMRENVLPILEAAGVDLVLAGHSHIYERSFLVDGAYDTPTTAAGHILDAGDGMTDGDGPYLKPGGGASNQGAVYVVAGHGGQSVGGPGNHPLMFFSEAENGSCVMTVHGNVLSLKNIRRDGAVSDGFVMVKGAYSGDCNADGIVGASDFSTFADCIEPPTQEVSAPDCLCADLNTDSRVDLLDFAQFQIEAGE